MKNPILISVFFSHIFAPIMDKKQTVHRRFSSAFFVFSSCLFSYTILPGISWAQEHPGCFMKDASGKLINLNLTICNPNPLPTSPEQLSPSSPNNTENSSRIFQVKIKRRMSNIPVIDVMFNGKQSFEMMVDSGASSTVITPAIAKALGATPIGEVVAQTPSGKAKFPLVKVASIAVGGLEIRDVEVGVANTLPVGLLGHDFFGDKDITIKENVIEFRIRS